MDEIVFSQRSTIKSKTITVTRQLITLLIPLFLLVLAVPFSYSASETIEQNSAYIAVANHDYLAVIDLSGGTLTETIDLSTSGCSFPWRVSIPPDGLSVWVTCRYSGRVIMIDRSSHEILKTTTVQDEPADIAFTQDSAHALVGSSNGSNVTVLNTSTVAVEATINTGYNPTVVVMHPYLPIAYVANRSEDGVITLIDTTSWTIMDQVNGGSYPHFGEISRDGTHLYLANRGNNSISVFNTVSLKKEKEVLLDVMPRDLAISGDGQTLYITRSWGDEIGLIDTNTLEVQNTINIAAGDIFYRPWGTELTCDGSALITTNAGYSSEEDKQIAITDTNTQTSSLIALSDQNSDGYIDSGARGLAVCPQYVPENIFLVPQSQILQANRGQDAIFDVTLYNFSGLLDSYNLVLGSHEWDTTISTDNINELDHGNAVTVTITVTVPEDVPWYAKDSINLTATSIAQPGTFETTAVIETEAYAPPDMTLSPTTLSSKQKVGDIITKTLDISNGAGVDLEFEIGTSFGPGTSFSAASKELYGYMVTGGFVRAIALNDDTDIQLIDLEDGTIIDQTTNLNRYESWEVYPSTGTYFKLLADKDIVALLSDYSYWGFTTFYPSVESGPVGRDFIFYHMQGDSSLYVFAIEDADVEIADHNGAAIDSNSLAKGEYWNLDPSSGVYHITSSGRISLELVAENSYTTVPSEDGQGVGRRFYFATDGWGTGAVAAFAYEDADIGIYELNNNTLLHSASISAGELWWQTGLEDLQLRLESSGDVEIWAGNTEGGFNIEDLGDDISFAGGRLGREYFLHSLREGFVVFTPFENTEISVDENHYSLGKDEYLHIPDCCGMHKIASNKPVLVQTLGRDGYWNDIGTYLGGVVPHSGEPVPWLSLEPNSGKVVTESSTPVEVAFDAAAVQPGSHDADLIVISNDPNRPFSQVPVTMEVDPTANMGSVSGTVTNAWTGNDMNASVTLQGVHTSFADPSYEIWAAAGAYTLSAAANGFADEEFTVTIEAGKNAIQNITMEPDMPRLETEPESLTLTAVTGSTATAALTIHNTGPASLEISLHEIPSQEGLILSRASTLKNRKILYDRVHDEPQISEFNSIVSDLTAAGAIVEENFVYPIDETLLSGYDLLWINCCGYTDWTFNELNALKSWLDSGGAVLIHGSESPATRAAADIYGITYQGGCTYGTTTDILAHLITIGVQRVYVDSCSYLTHSSSSIAPVKDASSRPHVVVHEENSGKMVVVAGSDFSNWQLDEEDNRLLANNIFAWLVEPAYEEITWLECDVLEKVLSGHSSFDVTVSGDASNLPPGSYGAFLAIEHNDPNQSMPVKVPLNFSVQSNGPTANFSASPASGPPPLIVKFSNLSLGEFDQCLWTFGDGEKETLCNDPVHSYEKEGFYTISLTVKGPGGEDTMTMDNLVAVTFWRTFTPAIMGN
jgi:YVTN family beta-propeller protein